MRVGGSWTVRQTSTRSLVDESLLAEAYKVLLPGAVNLAGISGQLATARDHSTSNYETVFAVNVAGTFNCMAAQLRNMRPSTKKTPGGSIVNAGSMAGLVGKTSASIYCASKHAVIGLTKAAAKEEATTTGIRVNAVAP